LLNETLTAEALWISNTNDGDGLVRPKIIYEWRGNVRLWLRMDLFYSNAKGLFGQFDDNDRLLLGVEMGW
jgi:hypothetical protein